MCSKSLQSYPTLYDSMDCLPGSSVHGILQVRILGWVAMPSSRESSKSGIELASLVSCIGRWFLYYWHLLGKPKGYINVFKPREALSSKSNHSLFKSRLTFYMNISIYEHI